MTTCSLMNSNQYGFRKGHSKINAVTKFTYDTLHALGFYNLSVFLDFSKAFDTTNHSLLCIKLHHYGIDTVALGVVQELSKMLVTMVRFQNTLFTVTCGVPQVSVWGIYTFYDVHK